MPEAFFYLSLILVALIIFGSMAIAGVKGAPWVPTKKRDLDRLIKLADIKDGDKVIELGSGDGRILIEIAQRCKIDAIGVEISLLPYLYSKLKLIIMNTIFVHKMKGQVKIVYKDMYEQNTSSADVVICFLMPKAIEKLENKFTTELKKGAKVISYVFPFKKHEALAIDKPQEKSISIFLYKF